MKNIVIVGAGGFGREVKTLIDSVNQIDPIYNFRGYYDDGFTKGTLINNFEVLGGISDLNAVNAPIEVAIAIGTPMIKKNILSQLDNKNIQYPVLIHPSVIYSNDDISIGKGSIICAGSILTCNINLGDFVILNLMCTVGHDTIIKDYASFMPSVNISGEVIINEGVYVGTGAKIINQLEIGENTIIGAGAVVSKSLPSNCTAVGIPAKIIKQN
jgi:sugar O-acyltransferase (sialic acid O-acetyltransferase NeuD family)